MVVKTMPRGGKRIANLSGFGCPKCNKRFLVFSFKLLSSRGYSCQTCGYTFMVSNVDLKNAGRNRRSLVLNEARRVLERKGF